jgi:hypothetical protein
MHQERACPFFPPFLPSSSSLPPFLPSFRPSFLLLPPLPSDSDRIKWGEGGLVMMVKEIDNDGFDPRKRRRVDEGMR